MKLSCTQENLNKGLNLVSRMISTRTALPILGHVLIKTDKGRLKLSATDLEIGINTWVGAKIESEGDLAIPGRLFADFVSACDDKKIDLQTKDQTLNLISEKYKSNIKGTSSEEFPLIPEIKEKPIATIPVKVLSEAISEVAIAAAMDEARPVLGGVFFRIMKDKIKLVATDSYRLAEKVISLNTKVEQEQSVIIPFKTMQELGRILSAISAENVDVAISENQIRFVVDDRIEIVSRLIEGNFPNYEQIMPSSFQTKITLDKDQFANLLRVTSLFAKESANNIKLEIDKKGSLSIIATASQVGDSTARMPVTVGGSSTEISFNAKFILDALAVIEGPKIKLQLNGKLDSGALVPTDSKNYIYIIMPLRTD